MAPCPLWSECGAPSAVRRQGVSVDHGLSETVLSRSCREAGVGLSRVELFAAIRRDRRLDAGLSQRALAEKYGVHRRTVRQALESAVPPPRKEPVVRRSVLDPAKGWIDEVPVPAGPSPDLIQMPRALGCPRPEPSRVGRLPHLSGARFRSLSETPKLPPGPPPPASETTRSKWGQNNLPQGREARSRTPPTAYRWGQKNSEHWSPKKSLQTGGRRSVRRP